ncbi:hypothetical protein XbrCFBP1976_21595, partial [Xanthomonas bromi]
VSVCTSAAEKVGKEFFGEASRSVAKMKAIGGWLGGFGTYIGVYYDYGDAATYWQKKDYQVAVLYGMKSAAGFAAGGAQFLTALVYSAPIIEKALGRRGLVIWLDALKAGLQAAVAKEGEDLLAKASMKRLGMAILRIGGWEVTVALIAIDILIYAIEPDALEKWCESNQFGKVEKGGLFGFGATSPHYKTLKEQDEAFQKAIGEVTVRPA